MQWFLDLETRFKLFAGFGLMMLLLLIIVITAYTGITSIQSVQNKLFEKEYPFSIEVITYRNNINRIRANLMRMATVDKSHEQEDLHKDIKEIEKEADENIQKLAALSAGDPIYEPRAMALSGAWNKYKDMFDKQVIPLIYAGKLADARTVIMGEQLQLYEELRDIAVALTELTEQNDAKYMAETKKTVKITLFLFVAGGFFALFIGIIMSYFLSRLIAKPLMEISGVAEKIAYGDLTVNVPAIKRKDEVGTLVMTFGMMLEALRMVTKEIASSSEVLATVSSALIKNLEKVGLEENENIKKAKTKAQSLDELGDRLMKLVEQYKV